MGPQAQHAPTALYPEGILRRGSCRHWGLLGRGGSIPPFFSLFLPAYSRKAAEPRSLCAPAPFPQLSCRALREHQQPSGHSEFWDTRLCTEPGGQAQAWQRLWFAQLSQGTAPGAPSAGGKPGTALPASAPGRSAARSPSRLQGRLLSVGEAGMDKAGLFPGEGAAFKLQITNLPHCCAHPAAGAVGGGFFGSPGGLGPFLTFPPFCSVCCCCGGVPGLGRGSSRAG